MSNTTARRGDWIQVASGGRFYPLDPRPEEIHIEDIAHALSSICRFTGHVSRFYSVAQHSALAAYLCPPEDRLWALLHDASEAYLCDLARPLKRLPEFAGYRETEALVMAAVCDKFGLAPEMPASVKLADEMLLRAEAEALMSPLDPDWSAWLDGIPQLPWGLSIDPWTPETAKRLFLHYFRNERKAVVMEAAR